ncbi:ACT domain-containing protein [Aquabacterium sp. A7-Y]|uniref:ACT domain-containing protein n=1 Tax=Aquabacterium sp. A7-Y TaxID=1349605 RepID=UPI00223D8825|nr:ACT domain-containing protein [Aquabacterium sp. A7-Y]MCW7537914.1 ACT domain-containing protein [Aquabacterium sp. A7-Y]
MSAPVSDLDLLLATLEPVLNPGVFVFCCLPAGASLQGVVPLSVFREAEGLTVIVEEAAALQAGWPVLFRAAWITLRVHSDLQAVGLTAAFATALGRVGISCNVIAAAFHDHLFVPVEAGTRALAELQALQQRSAARQGDAGASG